MIKGRGIGTCGPLALVAATWVSAAAALDRPDAGGGGGSGGAPLSCGTTVVTGDNSSAPLFWSVVKPTDPVHKGHLHNAHEPGELYPSPQCGVPNPVPPVVEPERNFHYKTHTFKNWTGADACVVVELLFQGCGVYEPCPVKVCSNPADCDFGVGMHESSIYSNAFDPTDIRKNFLVDGRHFEGGPGLTHMELTVPAGENFVLVVRAPDFDQAGYDPYYEVYAKGCGQAGAPAASSTPTAASTPSATPATTPPSSTPAPVVPVGDETADHSEARTASVRLTDGPVDEAESGGCNVGGGAGSAGGFAALVITAAAIATRRRRR